MKNLVIVIMTCCAVVAVVCLAVKAALPAQFWLWVVGLAGPVIGGLQFVLQYVRRLFERDDSRSQVIDRRESSGLRFGGRGKKIRVL